MMIDTRGAWPVLFDGMKATELTGCNRGITIEEAKAWVEGHALQDSFWGAESPETWDLNVLISLHRTYCDLAEYWVKLPRTNTQPLEFITAQAAHCARLAARYGQYVQVG
jgi:hypothetical protein